MRPDLQEFDLEHGRGYRLRGVGKSDIVAIVNDDGQRELQFRTRRNDELQASLRMDDDDARRLGAVLSGTRFRPPFPAGIRDRVGDIVVEWVHIDSSSLAVGKSLAELDLHRRTGMTAVSIVDSDGVATTPNADTVLQVDDHVVVVGQRNRLESFIDLLTS